MRALTQKLNSRRGASILFALLLFLVCAFVAAATLTAAYNTAARSTLAREEQQDYLAVSSAAEVLKKAVTEIQVVMRYSTYDTTTIVTDDKGNSTETPSPTTSDYSLNFSGALSEIGTLALRLFQGNSPSPTSSPLSFSLSGYPELENVSGELTMGDSLGKYNLTILLYNKDDKANSLTLSFNAGSETGEPARTRKEVTTGNTKVVTITTTTTTTVTWSPATVSQASG